MEPLRQQVIQMQRQVHDLLDRPNEAAAGRLKSELQGLEDDLQSGKNPRTIEDRVKRIISILGGEAKSAQIMNLEHLEMLKHWFERFRETIRKFE